MPGGTPTTVRYAIYLSLAVLLTSCSTSPPRPAEDVGSVSQQQSIELPGRPDPEAQHCLALAMYWEARGEGRPGMLAVGSVVMNRVEDHRFPDSVCGVVYQGGETPPCQFSWWCDGRSDRPTDAAQWSVSSKLAAELLSSAFDDPTDGALFFHSTSIRAPWRRARTAQIGGHIFYR